MPLPFIIAGIAVAAATGVGAGAVGHSKKKQANALIEKSKAKYDAEKVMFDKANQAVEQELDKLGKFELKIGEDFAKFDRLIQEIMENNNFKTYSDVKIDIPQHQLNEIKEIAIRATDYLGAIAGGAVGGVVASGFVTSMVVAFGAASTGTAISSLAGAAATNATLAAIGGGSLATGGLGIAGGTAILGGVAAAPILTVAGLFYAHHGFKALDNAEKVESEVNEAVTTMQKAKIQFGNIEKYVLGIYTTLSRVNTEFQRYFNALKEINELIKSGNREKIANISKDVNTYIQNGLALAAIMAKIISTPLFKLKKDNNGKVLLDANGQPQIQQDSNGFQHLNTDGIEKMLKEQESKYSSIPKI